MALILIVEDHPILRKLLRVTLELNGYEVAEAADGASALDAVRTRAPDLVLQDLTLPDLDGFVLAAQLRALLLSPRVPILAISGRLLGRADPQIAAAGFVEVIAKPVEPSRLLKIVQKHLGHDPPQGT